MELRIEPYATQHLAAIVELSLRAWAPVFESIRQVLGPQIYEALVPDWRASQQQAVETVCQDQAMHVWTALDAGQVIGFVAVKIHSENSMGEIYMLAVDPDTQGHGIGTALSTFALAWMKETGLALAMVETGGDPGHAPARRTYEKAGFGLLPIARYFKKL